MKLPQLLSQKRLRATTARRALGGAEVDYEEMSEPNMKLSRALLIVLVLHVVAVAGIIAFNTVKARQDPPTPVANENTAPNAEPSVAANTEAPTVVTATKTDEPRVAKAVAKPIAKDEHPVEPPKPVKENSTKPTAGRTYVVAKGDTPVSIARKFKVPYDDIMQVNGIDDPHKLKIGQKLIIPKINKPKKSDQ